MVGGDDQGRTRSTQRNCEQILFCNDPPNAYLASATASPFPLPPSQDQTFCFCHGPTRTHSDKSISLGLILKSLRPLVRPGPPWSALVGAGPWLSGCQAGNAYALNLIALSLRLSGAK
jgi:hypothetical protein